MELSYFSLCNVDMLFILLLWFLPDNYERIQNLNVASQSACSPGVSSSPGSSRFVLQIRFSGIGIANVSALDPVHLRDAIDASRVRV